MRVSANPDDPGHAAWMAMPNRYSVKIFLDDVEQFKVVTADDGVDFSFSEGFVYRPVLDAEGNIQIDPMNSDEIWMETVQGKVRIVVPA